MKTSRIKDLRIPKYFSLEKVGCTQSLAHCFRQCPLKFLFQINRWESKRNQERSAIGNINHYVLALIYKKNKMVGSSLIWKYIEKAIVDEKEKYKFIKLTDLNFFKTVCYCVLSQYVIFYEKDFKTAKFTNVENEFEQILFFILWRGKIDGEYIIKKDRSVWLLDHKCKSRINNDNITRSLVLDFQGRLYCRVRSEQLKKKVSGFIHNIIRTPQMRLRKNDTLTDFQNRLTDDIKKRPEYYFMRWEVPLTDQDYMEFENDLCKVSCELKDYLNLKDNDQVYKIRNTFACTDGIVPCEYLDACIQGNLSGYYQKNKIFSELDCGL